MKPDDAMPGDLPEEALHQLADELFQAYDAEEAADQSAPGQAVPSADIRAESERLSRQVPRDPAAERAFLETKIAMIRSGPNLSESEKVQTVPRIDSEADYNWRGYAVAMLVGTFLPALTMGTLLPLFLVVMFPNGFHHDPLTLDMVLFVAAAGALAGAGVFSLLTGTIVLLSMAFHHRSRKL